MAVIRYEFSFDTPTQSVDGQGNPVTVNVTTTFTLSGVSQDVAKGIRAGLRNVPTITNVAAARYTEQVDALP